MIYLAHGNDAQRKVVSANLELLAHDVRLSTDKPAVLMRRCQERPPDVAIVGSGFDDSDVYQVLNELGERSVCAVVALLPKEDLDRSRRLMHDNVMGVLVEPVNDSDLRTSIYLARRRFEQAREMKTEISRLESELNEIDESPSGEIG